MRRLQQLADQDPVRCHGFLSILFDFNQIAGQTLDMIFDWLSNVDQLDQSYTMIQAEELYNQSQSFPVQLDLMKELDEMLQKAKNANSIITNALSLDTITSDKYEELLALVRINYIVIIKH